MQFTTFFIGQQKVYYYIQPKILEIPKIHKIPKFNISNTKLFLKSNKRFILKSATPSSSIEEIKGDGNKSSAKPEVKIDNTSDAFATVVSITYGKNLEDMVDTMAAIRNLGLNIKAAKLNIKDDKHIKKFYVTELDTSEKVLKSARLEQIRLTILQNLCQFHPESEMYLNAGHRIKLRESRDPTDPLGPQHSVVVASTISIKESETGSCSELYITTKDRAGLLVDVVSVLKDINLNVISAEVDTIGDEAKQQFYLTYKGGPLNRSMQELIQNCLMYYLSLAEVEREESY